VVDKEGEGEGRGGGDGGGGGSRVQLTGEKRIS